MSDRRTLRHQGRRGFSLVEVIVAIAVLSGVVLGLMSGTLLAAQHTREARSHMKLWAAMQDQLEQLSSEGYAKLADGSADGSGYPMSWTVTGTDPKTVVLVAERRNHRGQTVLDSLVMYFSAADTL